MTEARQVSEIRCRCASADPGMPRPGPQSEKERSGWLERWREDRIAFHQASINPKLERYWPVHMPAEGSVFVPLCGKSLDMRFFENLGLKVVGVELAPIAIEAYFDAAGEHPVIEDFEGLKRYRGPRSMIYCADYFALAPCHLEGASCAYDRGSLIALPPALRSVYVEQLRRLLPAESTLLLFSLDYDQRAVDGPPFAIGEDTLASLFGGARRFERLEHAPHAPAPPRFQQSGVLTVADAVHRIEL